ncbi:MAG: von Willebrand factor type A domain-containing protein, partial [Oscillospiraceae bacterium]|nr:von Willebrand factor type A domain-containing protein [Oscillospiraceae bacterium]
MPLAFAAMMTFTGCGAHYAPTTTMMESNTMNAVQANKACEYYEAEACDDGSFAVPDFNTEEYSAVTENSFQSAAANPLSTFSADVDTASYSNLRRIIRDGGTVPQDAVRIEEMINYFHYDYPEPQPGEPFSVTTEIADCPWNADTKLMM